MLYILSVNYSIMTIKNNTRETLAEKGFHQNIQKKSFIFTGNLLLIICVGFHIWLLNLSLRLALF